MAKTANKATKAQAKTRSNNGTPSSPTAAKKGPKRAKTDAKMSALDAAAKVLQEADKPLNCQEMIAQMAAARYWTSPGGKTPASTLFSAILRELKLKGAQSRFRKVAKGHFAATGVA
jgi:hypothetical protein